MAADDSKDTKLPPWQHKCLSSSELQGRLEEEVNRAGRQHTALSCLLVSLDEADELARVHGEALPVQALAYLGAALGRQLRRFDRIGQSARGELLVVLPGADERQGEIVARRSLGRLHSIKLEVEGTRRPLRVSVGIASWQEGLSGEHLLSKTRLAAQRQRRGDGSRAEHHDASVTGPSGSPVPGRS